MIMSKYKFNKFLIIPIIRKSVFKYNFSFSPFFILYLKKSFFICFCSRLLDKFLSFDKKINTFCSHLIEIFGTLAPPKLLSLDKIKIKKKPFFICFCSRLLDKFLSFDKKNKFFLFSLNRNFCNFAHENMVIGIFIFSDARESSESLEQYLLL